MTKKCLGCGAILQSSDINKDGYINEQNIDNATTCERCYRISHYGDYKTVVKSNNDFLTIIDSINDTNDLILLIIDLFNINNDYIEILKRLNNDIVVVLTKRDLLPLSVKDEKLKEYVKELGINAKDSIIVSSNKNYNLDELIGKIRKYQKSKDVYVIGFTNAGKSTLINKLIYNYSDNLPTITTSMLPSTTLNKIEIELDNKLTLIDTPGILNEGNIANYIDLKTLKKITPKKEIRPITYQIKEHQFLIIDDMLTLEVESANITLFISEKLKITRRHKPISELNKQNSYDIKANNNEDIVINGLGFIKCTKSSNVKIYSKYNLDVFTRKSLV